MGRRSLSQFEIATVIASFRRCLRRSRNGVLSNDCPFSQRRSNTTNATGTSATARANRSSPSLCAAEPPLQIEEREPPTFLESDDFTVDNQLFLEVPGLIGQFWKLTGDAPQIARENFNALLRCDEAARGYRRICPPNKPLASALMTPGCRSASAHNKPLPHGFGSSAEESQAWT